jgi:hypothetical protein
MASTITITPPRMTFVYEINLLSIYVVRGAGFSPSSCGVDGEGNIKMDLGI